MKTVFLFICLSASFVLTVDAPEIIPVTCQGKNQADTPLVDEKYRAVQALQPVRAVVKGGAASC
jgi:hypothetical protein